MDYLRGTKTAEARLLALYALLPRLECRGLCAESCGPIGMTTLEARRIERLTGRALPMLDDETLVCPFLANRRCGIYPVRPLLCRLWGLVETMPCPFGCRPERYLTDTEAAALLKAARQLSGGQEVGLFPSRLPTELQIGSPVSAKP